jgi:hypothetical protein
VKHADVPATLFLRVIVLASIGLLASIWALVHHYTHPLMPTHVPLVATAATATPAWDAGTGFVEVDLENR